MPELIIAVPFWNTNAASKSFSSMYDESWVEKLYRGFKRHCTLDFEFVCFTERERAFTEPIKQMPFSTDSPSYEQCLEPYQLNEPMILCGLDTIVTGNIDHLAEYCLEGSKLAVPRDPFFPQTVCNGVALVPGGHGWVYEDWLEHQNKFTEYSKDMDYIRSLDVAVIDDLWPGHVVSYKGHVKDYGLGDARIVYFHGEQKPHELDADWIRREWV